jgi:hypothetical protein
MKYGTKPQLIGTFILNCKEMMFYQYLPIKLAYESAIRLPERLRVFKPLVDAALEIEFTVDKYIYLTAKYIYATPDNLGNRGGWHSDGFGTEDINYIWCDKFPTEFCIQDFNLSDDHERSMIEMEQQVNPANIIQYTPYQLLKLTPANIHRCPIISEGGFRAFVKISISTEKYNLVGNSHNYLLDYEWEMFEREMVRNHPAIKERDSVKPQ